jgi:hypothetical protein
MYIDILPLFLLLSSSLLAFPHPSPCMSGSVKGNLFNSDRYDRNYGTELRNMCIRTSPPSPSSLFTFRWTIRPCTRPELQHLTSLPRHCPAIRVSLRDSPVTHPPLPLVNFSSIHMVSSCGDL